MKKTICNFLLIIIFIVIFVIFSPIIAYFLLRIIPSNVEIFFTEGENIKIERKARDANSVAVENWIKSYFGPIVSEDINWRYKGRKEYSYDSEYILTSSFLSNYTLWVDSKTHKAYDDFLRNNYLDEIFYEDEKFQHLYSNYIKKQVGIEDENVELKFKEGRFDGRLVAERPYIDFSKITSLENLEEKICEKTHNLYIFCNPAVAADPGVLIKIKDDLELQDILTYADEIEEKVRSKVFIYDRALKEDEVNNFFIDTYNEEELLISICYNYTKGVKSYKDYREDGTMWIEYTDPTKLKEDKEKENELKKHKIENNFYTVEDLENYIIKMFENLDSKVVQFIDTRREAREYLWYNYFIEENMYKDIIERAYYNIFSTLIIPKKNWNYRQEKY